MRYSTAAWLVLVAALGSTAATLYAVHPAPARSSAASALAPAVLVGRIQGLARLETATVELETTVEGARGTGWMRAAAGEALVFRGIGRARAGVDLADLGQDDLWVDDRGVVWVRLPAAEIFEVSLDPDRSAVVARERGLFGRADPDFETEARRVALQRLRAQAGVVGLEEEAAAGARETVRSLLEGVGVEEVRFVANSQDVATRT